MAALVGRGEELGIIDELLSVLGDLGAGGVLEVAGEAGIGKTRLLDELRAEATRRDCLVLAGRAAEFGGELPFGVFVDALDDFLVRLGGARLADLAGTAAPLLAVALPAFEPLAAGSAPVLAEERFRTHRALRTLLSRLAEPHPVVLVLDDVHWADSGSIEALNHLLAYPPLGAVLLVVAFRPARLARSLASSLAERLRRDGARRLDLTPLGPGEALQLLGPAVPEPLRVHLVAQSGGNPLFLQERRVAPLGRRGHVSGRRALPPRSPTRYSGCSTARSRRCLCRRGRCCRERRRSATRSRTTWPPSPPISAPMKPWRDSTSWSEPG